MDVVLSSGFLAFAAQAGFLAGIEEAGVEVTALCGTSSGALVGALWSAGMRAAEIAALLGERRPLSYVRPHPQMWRGLLSLDPMLEELRARLPPRFDDLSRPFGVGVIGSDGRHALVTDGPLPESVAASCAIPRLFAPIRLEQGLCADGGLLDRTALGAWRAHRGEQPTILHLVDSTRDPRPIQRTETMEVVNSPRSGASLWALGDVEGRFMSARARTLAVLARSRF